MKIVIIGVGAMGGSLVAGWRARIGAEEICFVETDEARARETIETHGIRRVELADAAGAPIIVLAVKPNLTIPTLAAIAPTRDSLVISIAAGVRLSALEGAAPGVPCIRVMPNLPALVGAGTSGIAAGSSANSSHLSQAAELMDAVGVSVIIPESKMDALTAVSGSGPAIVFYLAEAMIEYGVHLGLTRPEASVLVNQTLLGSSRMLEESGLSATVLRERVTSPAGTTAAALGVLDERGVRAAIGAALRAARDRSEQMA